MIVGVIGAGSWGVALAQLCAASGKQSVVWARREEAADEINTERRSSYLPDVPLHPRMSASVDPSILIDVDLVLCVVPVQATRETLTILAPLLPEDATVVMCSKGVEQETLALPTKIARDALDNPLAVLSGPSFAADVVRGLPTAVTVAAETMEQARALQRELGMQNFRPYASDDMIGVQVGGAIKNVLAIACGIVAARGLGESARAALVARGAAEMTRLALALGGRAETLAGLSGMGDLVLTCGSERSRNFAAGLKIGDPATAPLARGVSEGTHTAQSAVALAAREGIEMPICETVCAILSGEIAVDDGIERLLARPLASEV